MYFRVDLVVVFLGDGGVSSMLSSAAGYIFINSLFGAVKGTYISTCKNLWAQTEKIKKLYSFCTTAWVMTSPSDPRQANLCLRAFRHDKF